MAVSSELLNELKLNRTEDEPGFLQRYWPWLLLPVLCVAAWVGYRLLGDSPLPVQTARAIVLGANAAANTSVLDATGYVVARRMATVSSKVTGRVRDVRIEEGQRIEEGEIMATLDPIDADAQLQLAKSQLAAARSRPESIRAQLVEAEANAQRVASLVERGLISRSQQDQAVATRDALRATLIDARKSAQVAADQLVIAEIGLDNTVVRAPFSGVVIAKAAQPGEIVSPLSAGGGFTRTGIGTIVDMDSLEIEVDVGESYIGRVAANMPVEAVLNAYPDWKIPAEVIATIPTADRGKATVKVRIGFKEKDARVVPDMGVRVSFLEAEQPDSASAPPVRRIIVPASTLIQREGVDLVFVVRDGRAYPTIIGIARQLGNDVEISAGLSGGETLIVKPPAALVEGTPVRPEPDQS